MYTDKKKTCLRFREDKKNSRLRVEFIRWKNYCSLIETISFSRKFEIQLPIKFCIILSNYLLADDNYAPIIICQINCCHSKENNYLITPFDTSRETPSFSNIFFLWMGKRESISPVLMFFPKKKHFIVWTYLSRTKLQILSPHAVLKLELRFKKFLVDLLRVHNLMGHFFKIRLSWGVI